MNYGSDSSVMGGLGQEALLVLATRIPRNGASWDLEWFVHILFEVGPGVGGSVEGRWVTSPELDLLRGGEQLSEREKAF